jgi:hypothetical protein
VSYHTNQIHEQTGTHRVRIGSVAEYDLDRLLAFLQSRKESQTDTAMLKFAVESALTKDWLTPEEDAA